MASVNFLKLHDAAEVKAMIRHSDTAERMRHEHSNKDIDKSQTHHNIDLQTEAYKQICRRYDKRIEELDRLPGANRRKDRVTCFGLSIPAPDGLDPEQAGEYFKDVYGLLKAHYRSDNMMGAYVHLDEIHSYIDHGEVKESRAHMHVFVVPEIDGKLNGKKFSSKAAMKKINHEIDALTRNVYGLQFMTGKEARRRTVEELKQLSEQEALKREKEAVRLNESVTEAQEELKSLTGEIKTAAEIKEQQADKNFLGKTKDTITLQYKEYKDLEATARAVEDVQQARNDLQEQEAGLQAVDGALRAREARIRQAEQETRLQRAEADKIKRGLLRRIQEAAESIIARIFQTMQLENRNLFYMYLEERDMLEDYQRWEEDRQAELEGQAGEEIINMLDNGELDL